jgi:hypothetical protein
LLEQHGRVGWVHEEFELFSVWLSPNLDGVLFVAEKRKLNGVAQDADWVRWLCHF